MKVYVIMWFWFEAEPYSECSGVYKIFNSRASAERHLEQMGPGPHEVDEETGDGGYFLQSSIREYDLEV